MQDFLEYEIFRYGSYILSPIHILRSIAVLGILFAIFWVLSTRIFPIFYKHRNFEKDQELRFKKTIGITFVILSLIGVLSALDLDFELFRNEQFAFSISTILKAILIFQIARLLDWLLSQVIIHNFYKEKEGEENQSRDGIQKNQDNEHNLSLPVKYSIYVLAIIVILRTFNLDFILYHFRDFNFYVTNIFVAILIILLAQIFAWFLTQFVLNSYFKQNKVNVGSQYAINQLMKYIIYVIAIFMAIESLGIQMTVIWGGAAALLVGVGLALQQTFNDLISGIILLFERSVEVGDVVDVAGLVGTVKRIGIRASIVESRDNITVVVPNSKLVAEKVVNWTHYDDKVRFSIKIGVAYGSDTKLVKKLLQQVVKENIYALNYPAPFVRFVDFGASSLDFEVFFWSRNFIVIEDIKSDMRFEIDQLFKDNNIAIPFPQRDIWIRKAPEKE